MRPGAGSIPAVASQFFKNPNRTINNMDTKKTTRVLRCILTEKELIESARTSAELTRGIGTLEDDKSRTNKDFAARIAEKESARSLLNDAISTGYVCKGVDCEVQLSIPKPGQKRIVRLDTMEEVAIESMTPDELQRELELDGGFRFDTDGVCVNPARLALRTPISGATVLIGKRPGDGGSYHFGFVMADEPNDGQRVEFGINAVSDLNAAVEGGVACVREWFGDCPAKKRDAGLAWLEVHAEAIQSAVKLLVAGKEVVVE